MYFVFIIKIRSVFWSYLRIPPSQNYTHVEPMAFSPLPPTQIEEEEEEPAIEVRRRKVRQLIDDDEEEGGSNKQLSNGSNDIEESEEEEEVEDNEELVDYKKQLFEMEAEESGLN